MSGGTIVWFRQDLRLQDNPALHAAVATGAPVIPVYIWSPEEEGEWAPGAASRWWLHHSLTALTQQLDRRGSRLILARGHALGVLQKLVAKTGATAVHWNKRYEPAAVKQSRYGVGGARTRRHTHTAVQWLAAIRSHSISEQGRQALSGLHRFPTRVATRSASRRHYCRPRDRFATPCTSQSPSP